METTLNPHFCYILFRVTTFMDSPVCIQVSISYAHEPTTSLIIFAKFHTAEIIAKIQFSLIGFPAARELRDMQVKVAATLK